MATSTGARPLMEMNAATADDPEADADTEGSGSSDNENSLLEGEQPTSADKQPLSMKQRIALVGALLLCVLTIFAFAFLLPCHKPKCQKDPGCPGKGDQAFVNWTDNLGGITPVMISLVDVTGDGRADILVEFKIEEKESVNSSFLSQLCRSTNCRGSGVMAIHGSCGYSLWNVSHNSSLGLLACEKVADRSGMNSNGHCLLVEERTNLLLFNSENGTTKWQSPSNHGVDSFKFVNDIDGDGERDIVIVQEYSKVYKKVYSEGTVNLVSGATGKLLGNSLPLPGNHGGSHVLAIHAPSSKQQFVIVGSTSLKGNSTSLWAISVSDLLEKVRQPAKKIPGQSWGEHTPDPLTGFISILKDTLVLIEPLLTDLDGDGVKDVVFVIKENSLSLLATNGKDLTVMWRVAVPSNASIHKLFPTQHYVKENSTHDVGVFVSYTNHSSGILVIDGRTGELSWLFHSMTDLPVAPISVPGDLISTQQAFVMWLPKLEALTLIAKPRKSRQIGQQGSDGKVAEKPISRQRRHQQGHQIFPESDVNYLDGLFDQEFDDVNSDNDFDYRFNSDSSEDDYDDGDDDNDDDDDIAAKEFQLAFLSEILKKYSDDPSLSPQKRFNTFEEHYKADSKWLSAKKVGLPLHMRGYNEDLIPISGDENSDVIADLDMHTTALEEELSDLPNHKKDETNHNAKEPQAPISRDYSAYQSNRKVLKKFPPEPTRRADEENDLQITSRNKMHNQQFLAEDGHQANLKEVKKVVAAKKPSYHKRSVQSSQSRSQCGQSSSDSTDSYMAVLLVKDANGRQLITEITEEGPLYLGPGEYENLFNVKDGDAKPKSCLRLVPSLISEPVLRDSDEGLDLVYTVSFVSEDQSVHVGKIRKMSLTDVFQRLEGKIVATNIRRHKSKREYDYSFSFPRVLK